MVYPTVYLQVGCGGESVGGFGVLGEPGGHRRRSGVGGECSGKPSGEGVSDENVGVSLHDAAVAVGVAESVVVVVGKHDTGALAVVCRGVLEVVA